MNQAAAHLLIALCSISLEVGWVASVRLVTSDSVTQLVLAAMAMQGISYCSTLILVSAHLSMVTGIIGAGLGAWIAMRIPASWLRRADPIPR